MCSVNALLPVGFEGQMLGGRAVLDGMAAADYRGYHGAGVAFIPAVTTTKTDIIVYKHTGQVKDLREKIEGIDAGIINVVRAMIGHTRWPTHGTAIINNTHPHVSTNGLIALVHNGIISNYRELKQFLISKGFKFRGQTDSEVVVKAIEYEMRLADISFPEAVRRALKKVQGAYAIVVIHANYPDMMVVARNENQILIGVLSDGSFMPASDGVSLIKHTKEVYTIQDKEIAVLHKSGKIDVMNLEGRVRVPLRRTLQLTADQVSKNGYPYFMEKEIFEQREAFKAAIAGRITPEGIVFDDLKKVEKKFRTARMVYIVACGTSKHSCMSGEHFFQEYTSLNVKVMSASEFRTSQLPLSSRDLVIFLSQSGETADTQAAVIKAKAHSARTIGVTNVSDSAISREVHGNAYIQVGPEISVASTKAFTGMTAVLLLLAVRAGMLRGEVTPERYAEIYAEIMRIPELIQKTLEQNNHIRELAARFKKHRHMYTLGRRYGAAVALEMALKVKEISYIHAEGYEAGESKHGPIALITPAMPTAAVATDGPEYERMVGNIMEIRARKGPVIAIATEGNHAILQITPYVIYVPKTVNCLTPFLTVLVAQLYAYHVAVLWGRNPDRPRNLAKAVTVE